jgi:hypothetical protein
MGALIKTKQGRQEMFGCFMETTMFQSGVDPVGPEVQAPVLPATIVHTPFGSSSSHIDTRIDYMGWDKGPHTSVITDEWWWHHTGPNGDRFDLDLYYRQMISDVPMRVQVSESNKRFGIAREHSMAPVLWTGTLYYKDQNGASWEARHAGRR